MATPTSSGINGAWSMYRQCATTAAYQKSQLELFTKISLCFGIVGAACGIVPQLASSVPTSTLSKVFGIGGSWAVALAGAAAIQAVSGNRDKVWIKCRAAGEGLKSAVFLYCAAVPPFDDLNRAAALGARVEKALKNLEGIDLRPGKVTQPPGPLSTADYITSRVDDQIDWYTNTAITYQQKADFWRYCGLAGASLSAVLGAVSAMYSLSAWVGLLATVTTSVTAFVRNQRYESMIGLYQATATRLQLLKDQWLDSGKTDADKADRDSFIQRCEDTLSLENGAWVAQWSERPAQQNQPPADPHSKNDLPENGTPKPGDPIPPH